VLQLLPPLRAACDALVLALSLLPDYVSALAPDAPPARVSASPALATSRAAAAVCPPGGSPLPFTEAAAGGALAAWMPSVTSSAGLRSNSLVTVGGPIVAAPCADAMSLTASVAALAATVEHVLMACGAGAAGDAATAGGLHGNQALNQRSFGHVVAAYATVLRAAAGVLPLPPTQTQMQTQTQQSDDAVLRAMREVLRLTGYGGSDTARPENGDAARLPVPQKNWRAANKAAHLALVDLRVRAQVRAAWVAAHNA
jgi:hypothetical protein